MPPQVLTSPDRELPVEPRPLEQRVELCNVSWETYQRLADEIRNPGKRLSYEDYTLEITCLSQVHERISCVLSRLFQVIVEELDIPIASFGATSWLLDHEHSAIQPDQSYYITNEACIRRKVCIDLSSDPPPDLAIEVENTQSAIDRMRIYATMGVPEVWRFDGQRLVIFGRRDRLCYSEQTRSQYLPQLAITKLVEGIGNRDKTDDTTLAREFRRWVRENLVQSR